MKKLLNTLFILTDDYYLSLEGESVVITEGREKIGQFPLHIFEGIISFSYSGASPELMGACAANGIGFAFCAELRVGAEGISFSEKNNIGLVMMKGAHCRTPET